MPLRTSAAGLTATLTLCLAACGSDDIPAATTAAAPAAVPAKPVVAVDRLDGRSTAIFLAPGFAASLGKLGAKGAPLGDTEISATGRTTYPITGGRLKYFTPGTATPALQGSIEHDGSGLRLSNGASKVDLRDFVIDVDKLVMSGDVSIDGDQVGADTAVFALDAKTLKPKLDDRTGVAVLSGFTVKLEPSTATLLNKAFGVQGVRPDQTVGSATVTVDAK